MTKQSLTKTGAFYGGESDRKGILSAFVPYSDAVEVISKDENEIITKILELMHRLSDRTQKQYGHAIRVSHAKSHGVAVGELVILDDLPEPLRQGLFAVPGGYPVIARLANVPGEIVSDAISTQRGLAQQVSEDPYSFDFLTLGDGVHDRDLESSRPFGPRRH